MLSEVPPPPKRPKLLQQGMLLSHFASKSTAREVGGPSCSTAREVDGPSCSDSAQDSPSSVEKEAASQPTTEAGEEKREPSSCTAACCLGAMLEPNQAADRETLAKTQRKQGDRQRSFNSGWFKSFPLLTLCSTAGKVYCWHCRTCFRQKRFENVL